MRLDNVARIIGRISRPSTTTPRLSQLAVAGRSSLDLPEQSASCLQAHSPPANPTLCRGDEIASAVLVHEYVQVSCRDRILGTHNLQR
jgi:hypothetical protein